MDRVFQFPSLLCNEVQKMVLPSCIKLFLDLIVFVASVWPTLINTTLKTLSQILLNVQQKFDLSPTTDRTCHKPLPDVFVSDGQWGHSRDGFGFLCVSLKSFAQRTAERGGRALQRAPVFTCRRTIECNHCFTATFMQTVLVDGMI